MGERAGMHQRLTTAGGGVADLPDHVHPRTVVLFRQEHLGQNHVIADPRHVHEPDVGRQELTAAFDVVGDVYFRGLEEMCILEGVGVSTSKY